jgi:hypothetical protein
MGSFLNQPSAVVVVADTGLLQVWSTAGERPAGDEPFLTWLVDLASNKSPLLPHVYSMSYQDYEYTVTPSYASQVSDMFGKLNLIGYTFVRTTDYFCVCTFGAGADA